MSDLIDAKDNVPRRLTATLRSFSDGDEVARSVAAEALHRLLVNEGLNLQDFIVVRKGKSVLEDQLVARMQHIASISTDPKEVAKLKTKIDALRASREPRVRRMIQQRSVITATRQALKDLTRVLTVVSGAVPASFSRTMPRDAAEKIARDVYGDNWKDEYSRLLGVPYAEWEATDKAVPKPTRIVLRVLYMAKQEGVTEEE